MAERQSDDDEKDEEAEKACCTCPYFPRRYLVAIFLFLGMFFAHAMRVNVAVAVVTILDKTSFEKLFPGEVILSIPSAEWDSDMVGFLHAVFYIGYFIMQLPGGYLCTILPSQRIFGSSVVVSSALNLMLPLCIDRLGYTATCCVRALQGLSEGLLFPGCYAVMSNWSIPEERSRVGALVLTGIYIGPFVGLTLSGLIAQYYGWDFIFYVHGAAGIIWFVFWQLLCFERPANDPYISEQERALIESQQGLQMPKLDDIKVPWKKIFTSLPVYALCLANFARSFVFFFLVTNEPAYMNVFQFTLATNGIFSALPHALMAVVSLSGGSLADYLISNKKVHTTKVRKAFTLIGFGVEALCMSLLGFIETGYVAVTVLTVGVGVSGFTVSGWQINHLDLAPRFASVLVAMTTAVGTLAGIFMPLIVGAMTRNQMLDEWQHVFILTSIILILAVVFYTIFGSGKLQEWATPTSDTRGQIVQNESPLETQPYGTFKPQVEHDQITSEK